MNERGESKLRFKDDLADVATSGQFVPKSTAKQTQKNKAKRQFQLEDKTVPNAPTPSNNISPTTSGQVDPKLKQDSKKEKPSNRLRRDGETSPLGGSDSKSSGESTKGGNTLKNGGTSRDDGKNGAKFKADKSFAQESKQLNKSKLRMEKTTEKLGVAKETLAAQKPIKRPGVVGTLGNVAKFKAWAFAHGKIREVEHENVGTEATHKTELAGEGVYRVTSRFIKKRIRTAPARKVRKLAAREVTAKADYAYRKLVQDNPELQKNALKRLLKKRQLKKYYQKQAKQTAKQAAKQGAKATKTVVATTKKAAAAITKAVTSNPKVLLVLLCAFLLIIILQSCMAMVVTIGNGLTGAVVYTSYLAEDTDIDKAELSYTEWETDLLLQAQNAENTHSGYDEYRYNMGDVSHNPYELMAFLTAVYDDFTYTRVQGVLQQIFNEQYTLTFTPEIEIRYREETRTGTSSWTDSEGNSHSETYTYTVIVEYEWHILNVNLTARPFTSVILPRMNEEQKERYNIYMITKGNRQYWQSPFGDYNWLPFVTSYYGYRIHPISGAKDRHLGVDIAMPAGTEILAAQDGTVTFAGNNGGYGLVVVIDNGEGLVSKYAHCSVLIVSAGQTITAGQPIAKVGSTGTSTGAHLHFEVIKDGQHLNPLFFAVTNDFNAGPTYGDPGTPMGDGSFSALIAEAERHLGKPYVFGANGPNSFDCSSYVAWVFTHSGVYNLPRTTAQGIFNQATPIPASEARPGDIITFTGTYSTPNAVSHIGIYVGNNTMIHAGSPIQYTRIDTTYWQNHFYSFARLGN